MTNANNNTTKTARTYNIIRDITVLAVDPLNISIVISIFDLDKRQAVQTSQSWTAQEEAAANSTLAIEMTTMRQAVADRLDGAVRELKSGIPTPEVRQRLESIDDRLLRLEQPVPVGDRLDSIDKRLERIEERIYKQ
jgi:hypothetical protein